MSIDEAAQKKLREKFDQATIGLKPKVTCSDCSKKRCNRDDHKPQRCNGLNGDAGCKQWITPRHIHVEFVGHADVTDRLLQVDPEWDWEPLAYADDGLPRFTADGGLWIRLTICGKTRIGYGGSDGKTGDDGVKEAISDALKVTAMRFGVALDLWRKSETSGKAADDDTMAVGRGEAPQRRNGQQRPAPEQAEQPVTADDLRATIKHRAKQLGTTYEVLAGVYHEKLSRDLDLETEAGQIQVFINALDKGQVELPNRKADAEKPAARKGGSQDTAKAARVVVDNRAKAMGVEETVLYDAYRRHTGKPIVDETDPAPIRQFIADLDAKKVEIGAGAST